MKLGKNTTRNLLTAMLVTHIAQRVAAEEALPQCTDQEDFETCKMGTEGFIANKMAGKSFSLQGANIHLTVGANSRQIKGGYTITKTGDDAYNCVINKPQKCQLSLFTQKINPTHNYQQAKPNKQQNNFKSSNR